MCRSWSALAPEIFAGIINKPHDVINKAPLLLERKEKENHKLFFHQKKSIKTSTP